MVKENGNPLKGGSDPKPLSPTKGDAATDVSEEKGAFSSTAPSAEAGPRNLLSGSGGLIHVLDLHAAPCLE